MYALVVNLKIKPEQRERFLSVAEEDSISSERDEPGCLRFNVLQDEADENSFYLYEIYRDKDAFEAHRQTPHLKRFAEMAAEAVEARSATFTNTVVPRNPGYWEKR